jgi:hypothetical protein
MSQEIANTKFNYEIGSLKEAMEYAKLISESDLAPKDYRGKPGNVLIAMQFGAEIGLLPLQAVQNIAVINGRPSVWGDAMIALVQSHPLCEYIHEHIKDGIAHCTVKRRNEEKEYTYTFSKQDAQTAGLLSKPGTWTQYPDRMLQMRARGFALRDKFADVLKGVAMREEVEDYHVVDMTEKKESAKEKVAALIENKSKDFIHKIETAGSVEDLKSVHDEVKTLLKEKKSQLTQGHNPETGEVND